MAATPAELAAASDLVCLCVVGDDDVHGRGDREPTACWPDWHSGGIIAIHAPCIPTPAVNSPNGPRATGCYRDRRAGQRRWTGRGGRHRCWSWSAATTTIVEQVPPGVRDLRRPDRPPRRPGLRPGHQDPQQPVVHRQSRHRQDDSGSRRARWAWHRRSSPRSSAAGRRTASRLASVARFGGNLDILKQIAGALLQKDVSHIAEPRRQRRCRTGSGVRSRRRRAECCWTTRDEGRASSARAGWGRRWCAAWSTPATTSRVLGRDAEKRSAIAELGARPGRGAGRGGLRRRRRRRVRVHRRAGAPGLPRRRPARRHAARIGAGAAHHRQPRTAEALAERGRHRRGRRGRRAGQRRTARHRRGDGDAVRRRRRRRGADGASAAVQSTATRSCTSGRPAAGSW